MDAIHRTPRPRSSAKSRGDAGKTRVRLVEAAAHEFNTGGYFATDTNRIARVAGYAPGTFYKHFRDKREIFLAAYLEWVQSEWQQIRAEYGKGARKKTSRKSIVGFVVEHHRHWAGFRRSLRALAATDETVRDFRLEQRREQMRVMSELRAPGSAADQLYVLLVFERICDAIADGEAEALAADETTLVARLTDLLE